MITVEQAASALKSMDLGVDSEGPRKVLIQFIQQCADSTDDKIMHPVLDVALPLWVVQQARRISEYMELHHPGHWAIAGIQRRT